MHRPHIKKDSVYGLGSNPLEPFTLNLNGVSSGKMPEVFCEPLSVIGTLPV